MKALGLLPSIDNFKVDYLSSPGDTVVIHMTPCAQSVQCPYCGSHSSRVHSHYHRTLSDIPWGSWSVRISLRIRKFFCDNSVCAHRIFSEQPLDLASRYARRTKRLENDYYLTGYLLGGRAGAKEANGHGRDVSRDTLLRCVRRASAGHHDEESLKVIGVDDWAMRRGQRYGTVLVDLENHRPVGLLPDRRSETLSSWLEKHPGIEVVTRDRAAAYAEAARIGAPNAEQVADRWHILKNMVEALERLLARHHGCIKEAGKQANADSAEAESAPIADTVKTEIGEAALLTKTEQMSQLRKDMRKARYDQAVRLYSDGVSIRQIALTLDLDRRTVRRFIKSDGFPERVIGKRRVTQFDKYREHLKKRWDNGCHNGAELYRELKAMGFPGAQSALRQYLRSWRKRLPRDHKTADDSSINGSLPPVQFSPGSASWLLLGLSFNSDERQKEIGLKFVQHLIDLSPTIQQAQMLAVRFFSIVREHKGDDLTPWIEEVARSGLADFKSFAQGIQRDYSAVLAGITKPWSNGQTEGQVNRIKLIKRSMYGRANFDLLQARVMPLLATQ